MDASTGNKRQTLIPLFVQHCFLYKHLLFNLFDAYHAKALDSSYKWLNWYKWHKWQKLIELHWPNILSYDSLSAPPWWRRGIKFFLIWSTSTSWSVEDFRRYHLWNRIWHQCEMCFKQSSIHEILQAKLQIALRNQSLDSNLCPQRNNMLILDIDKDSIPIWTPIHAIQMTIDTI